MRIPEIRERLIEKGQQYGDDELIELAIELWRRRSTRAPDESTPMSPRLAYQIRLYASLRPTATQRAIGNAFNVSQGRVSEALHGKRT